MLDLDLSSGNGAVSVTLSHTHTHTSLDVILNGMYLLDRNTNFNIIGTHVKYERRPAIFL